jgi:uncharacterized protein (TIGR04552 family)
MRSDHAVSLESFRLHSIGLQDAEQVRLLLNGDSVLDWRQLAFRDRDQIDAFLRLVGFEPNDPTDAMRLMECQRRALDYLDCYFELDLRPIRAQRDVQDVLMLASRSGEHRAVACTVLKVMHVVHHVAGRELLMRLPVATNELFHRIETRVYRTIDGMKGAGIRLAEFAGSRKTADSILTKLLSRSDSLAAEVHDRLRFRVVTETMQDLFSAVVYLIRHLFPFNYVVPNESRNDLLDLAQTMAADPTLASIGTLLQAVRTDGSLRAKLNAFSGRGYQMINFVADIPVRVDDLVSRIPEYQARDGAVVFLLTEFQLVDRETAARNEVGANHHSLYKRRQHQRVLERVFEGEGQIRDDG